jgi:hypothetical protein
MPNDTTIFGPTELSGGVYSCDTFTVVQTGSLKVTGHQTISAQDNILILGPITCTPGASLSLVSANRDIWAQADITGGQGVDATDPGGHGGPAGKVSLAAPRGRVLVFNCKVKTLRGGHGNAASTLVR